MIFHVKKSKKGIIYTLFIYKINVILTILEWKRIVTVRWGGISQVVRAMKCVLLGEQNLSSWVLSDTTSSTVVEGSVMSVTPLNGPVGGGETMTEIKNKVDVILIDENSNCNNVIRRRANVFDLDKLAGADLIELEESVEKFDWDKVSDFVPLLLRLVVTKI